MPASVKPLPGPRRAGDRLSLSDMAPLFSVSRLIETIQYGARDEPTGGETNRLKGAGHDRVQHRTPFHPVVPLADGLDVPLRRLAPGLQSEVQCRDIPEPHQDVPQRLCRACDAGHGPGPDLLSRVWSPAHRTFAPRWADDPGERRLLNCTSPHVLDSAHGLAIHRKPEQLDHRLPYRLRDPVRLSYRQARRTRVGSRCLGQKASIHRASSQAATAGGLTSKLPAARRSK